MLVNEAMSPDVKLTSPDNTIQEAARAMAEIDAGILPVGDGDKLVGMITDRDIAVRAVARGLSPQTKVREVMSSEVLYCYDDENVEAIAENMAENQIRRLPVLNRDKRLVGIVSLGDIAITTDDGCAGETLVAVSEPGGRHSQQGDGAGALAGR